VHGAVSDAFHTALAIPGQLHTLTDGSINLANVRFWHKADVCYLSGFGGKADI
jgi:hypothetical protein